MNIQRNVTPEKIKKLQEMARVKYHRSRKRYELAFSEWQECQKPYSIADNLKQYEVTCRILTEELEKQMQIVRHLQQRLDLVLQAMDTLKNSPEQVSMLHMDEIEAARQRMEEAHLELIAAEERCEELENYFDPR